MSFEACNNDARWGLASQERDCSGASRDAMSFEACNDSARGLVAPKERDCSGALRDAMSFEASSHHSSLSAVSLETARSGAWSSIAGGDKQEGAGAFFGACAGTHDMPIT
jgi:hypothetical protein